MVEENLYHEARRELEKARREMRKVSKRVYEVYIGAEITLEELEKSLVNVMSMLGRALAKIVYMYVAQDHPRELLWSREKIDLDLHIDDIISAKIKTENLELKSNVSGKYIKVVFDPFECKLDMIETEAKGFKLSIISGDVYLIIEGTGSIIPLSICRGETIPSIAAKFLELAINSEMIMKALEDIEAKLDERLDEVRDVVEKFKACLVLIEGVMR